MKIIKTPPGFEPGTLRMRSGCDTTTPQSLTTLRFRGATRNYQPLPESVCTAVSVRYQRVGETVSVSPPSSVGRASGS